MRRPILLLRVVAACAAGTASALAFAPIGWSWLAPPALGALFFLAARAPGHRQAFGLGMAFGFAFFLSGLPWLFQALSGYIGFPIPAAAIVMALFCLLLALFPALSLVGGRLLGGSGEVARLFACAACWTLTEWSRGWMFTGFPWLSVGYSQIPGGIFSGWAPLAGVHGIGFALALASACLVAVFVARGKGRLVAAGGAILLAAAPALPNAWLWTTPAGKLSVSLLQGNVKQELKWEPGQVEQALADYLKMAQNAEGRVIILPETALPMTMEDLEKSAPGYVAALREEAGKRYGAVIVGMFLRDDNGNLHNAAVSLEESGRPRDYRKRHLTPYGEYMPFATLLKPLLDSAGIPYNSLAAGQSAAPLPLPDGARAGISICYEDAFGDEWREQLPAANFLVNLTNDGWFDGSVMARQHLQISQARALETGRWLARATNTGETAIIDERGRIVSSLPPQVSGVLSEEIELRRGATPYVIVGDWAAVLTAAATLLGILLARGVPRLPRLRRRREKAAADAGYYSRRSELRDGANMSASLSRCALPDAPLGNSDKK